MDKKESSNVAELSIPKSDVNTVLSSAGNGLTIGGIPLIGTEFYHRWMKNSHELPRNLEKACIFTAVAGCAIGAVVGLIGGIKVYGKFSAGDPDTSKTAASWFGACIFLIVSATILRSFFL